MSVSAGSRFKTALKEESPLQVVGLVNAYSALLASQAGFKALYLSGAVLANANFGLPDLGMTSFTEMAQLIAQIRGVSDLPLLVDADTGFGSVLTIERMVKLYEQSGAGGLHLEDQTWPKRCGHREGKTLVPLKEMQERLKAAVNVRTDPDFIIMARTDSYGIEPFDKVLERMHRYVEVGADMIFAEAVATLEDYQKITQALSVPVLANITEFGKTPLFSVADLKKAKISMALYPVSAFRAMALSALTVYETLRKKGTQESIVPLMQTREELYKILNYYEYEAKISL